MVGNGRVEAEEGTREYALRCRVYEHMEVDLLMKVILLTRRIQSWCFAIRFIPMVEGEVCWVAQKTYELVMFLI